MQYQLSFRLFTDPFHHFSSLNYLLLTLMRVATEKSICLPNRSLKALVRKSIRANRLKNYKKVCIARIRPY